MPYATNSVLQNFSILSEFPKLDFSMLRGSPYPHELILVNTFPETGALIQLNYEVSNVKLEALKDKLTFY